MIGDDMSYKEKLLNLIQEHNGLIFTRQVSEAGIPRAYLSSFVQSGLLDRLERGVYITQDSYDDEMYRYQVKYKAIIYSHDTALFLHDLTDRDPIQFTVTVPEGYNANNLRTLGLKVFSLKRSLFTVGLSKSKTAFNREVRCYNMERTICDIIRSRNQIDIAIVSDAIKRYVKRNDRNLPLLMRYAEKMRVANILRNYMEVVL